MIELNLLPDVKQEFVRAQRLKRVIIASMILVSIIAVGIVTVSVVYVYGVQTGRQFLADGNIKKENDQLKKDKNLTRNLTLQNQLVTVKGLHEEKGVFSR